MEKAGVKGNCFLAGGQLTDCICEATPGCQLDHIWNVVSSFPPTPQDVKHPCGGGILKIRLFEAGRQIPVWITPSGGSPQKRTRKTETSRFGPQLFASKSIDPVAAANTKFSFFRIQTEVKQLFKNPPDSSTRLEWLRRRTSWARRLQEPQCFCREIAVLNAHTAQISIKKASVIHSIQSPTPQRLCPHIGRLA